jgi:hypothetical protein
VPGDAPAAVPEPGSMTLLATGLLMMLRRSRRAGATPSPLLAFDRLRAGVRRESPCVR